MGAEVTEVPAFLSTFVSQITSNDVGFMEKLDSLHKLQSLSETFGPISTFSPICKEVVKCLIYCISAPSQTIRATGLRVAKLLCVDNGFLEEIIKGNVGYFIASALEKSKQIIPERIQALKFIRKMIEINALIIPKSVVRALIAIATQEDDNMTHAALITLCELAIHNGHIVAATGGITVIISAIVNIKPLNESLQSSLIVALTYLLDDHITRKYIHPHDIALLIEPFTDTYEPSEEIRQNKLICAKSGIAKILKSWTGLICFLHNPLLLKAFVSALTLPDIKLNHVILDSLYAIFHLPLPNNLENESIQQTQFSYSSDPNMSGTHNLLDNYLAMLLVAFSHANLFENLLKLNRKINTKLTAQEGEEGRGVSRKVTCLIGELLHLSNRILPPTECAMLQALPLLVHDAISFTLDPRLRSLAGTTVTVLDKYSLMKRQKELDCTTDTSTTIDYFDELKRNINTKIDELTFKQKLNESVLLKKDSTTWDWETISELVEGALANPTHFNSPLASKYIKKLLSFYKPSNKLFPNLPIDKVGQNYGRIGCQIIRLLISHDNSTLFMEHPLLPQVSEVLKHEVEQKGAYFGMISKEKILQSMSKWYFEMIGILSESKLGLDLIVKMNIFDWLTPLSTMPGRDDLSNLIIKLLKYDKPGPSRVLLAKSLSAQSRVVRFYATRQIQQIMRSHKRQATDFSEWGIRFLVQKLTDADSKVASLALSILDECVYDTNCLDSLITKKALPVLSKLGKPGNDLIIRFLSRPYGFDYLSSASFLIDARAHWRQDGYQDYVKFVEHALADAFAAPIWSEIGGFKSVPVPVHLYGELVQTREGCKLIESSGDFDYFLNIVTSKQSSSLQIRGALWVIGHIGKYKIGYKEFFPKFDIIKLLLHITKHCTCLAVKGTCIYVLGLVSQTRSAAKSLENMGWESKRESFVTVPKSLSDCGIFDIPDWGVGTVISSEASTNVVLPTYSDSRDELIKHFANLSNKLTFDKSLNAIKRLKTQEPDLFENYDVQHQIFKLLENYTYRLPPRRFFYQIFAVHWTKEKLDFLPECVIQYSPEITPDQCAVFPEFTFSSKATPIEEISPVSVVPTPSPAAALVDRLTIVAAQADETPGPQSARPAPPPRSNRPSLGTTASRTLTDAQKPEPPPTVPRVKPPPPKIIPGRGSRTAIQPPSTPPPMPPQHKED